MTPHQRAVEVVETIGWIVETTAPVSVPMPDGTNVEVKVRTVTIKCPMLVDLIAKAIEAAVADDRKSTR